MTDFIYRNARTTQISFPLGGIGAGAIGLAGNGRLIDWEIFNRWGEFELTPERAEVRLLYGRLDLNMLTLPLTGEQAVTMVETDGAAVPYAVAAEKLLFGDGVRLLEGSSLSVMFV